VCVTFDQYTLESKGSEKFHDAPSVISISYSNPLCIDSHPLPPQASPEIDNTHTNAHTLTKGQQK